HIFKRPTNKEELYNLWHASAWNAVERIFGVLKWCFVLLSYPPKYAMSIQVHIPPALAAVHNFIQKYDPEEICEFGNVRGDPSPGLGGNGTLREGPPQRLEILHAMSTRNLIAGRMWEHYQRVIGGLRDE
ncbi:hypothetical protein H4582DRAFT_1815929, partial [Lactarius indigo]